MHRSTPFLSNRSLLLCLTALLWAGAAALQSFPDAQGVDFFPYVFAARLAARGADIYSAESVAALRAVWQSPVASVATLPYPMTILPIFFPFLLVDMQSAVCIWFLVLLGGVAVSARYAQVRNGAALLPLLFFPVYRALLIKQPTLFFFALCCLMLLCVEKKRPRAAAIAAVFLPWKPQNCLLIFLYGCADPRARALRLAWTGGSLLFLAAASLLLSPHWLPDWYRVTLDLKHALEGSGIIQSLLPAGLVLVLCSLRVSPLAVVAVLQVILFPINDMYSLLPLCIAWIEIGGALALCGAALSWLGPLTITAYNSLHFIWLTLLLPYAVCAALRSTVLRKTPVCKDSRCCEGQGA